MRRIRLLVLIAGTLTAAPFPAAAEEGGWFKSFERIQLAPVERNDTTQLVDAGTLETDGFSELVFSLGGEFKEGIPESGRVGVVLIPDKEFFLDLLRTEGEFVFPLEVQVEIRNLSSERFMSKQERAKVAFPRYRVFLYNETASGAVVSLFVYRTR